MREFQLKLEGEQLTGHVSDPHVIQVGENKNNKNIPINGTIVKKATF